MTHRFELAGVDVRFGVDASLRHVDLTIGDGEVVAVVGPSGAGKTTLLRTLAGALAPTAGLVRWDGRPLGDLTPQALREVRSRIGFVHQHHALVPNLRVVQNVVSGRLGRRGAFAALRSLVWPSQADLTDAHAILDRLGIAEKMYLRTDTLSGGELQRVAVARALFQEPLALLADEPVASVDPERARRMIELLVDLARDRGLTLIASLHDLSLAAEYFPRMVGLRAGAVAFDRPTSELRQRELQALYELPASAHG